MCLSILLLVASLSLCLVLKSRFVEKMSCGDQEESARLVVVRQFCKGSRVSSQGFFSTILLGFAWWSGWLPSGTRTRRCASGASSGEENCAGVSQGRAHSGAHAVNRAQEAVARRGSSKRRALLCSGALDAADPEDVKKVGNEGRSVEFCEASF